MSGGWELYSASSATVGTSYVPIVDLQNGSGDNPPAKGEIGRVDVKITAGAGTTVDIEVYDTTAASGYKLAEDVGSGKSVLTLLLAGAAYTVGSRSLIGVKVKTDDAGGGTTVVVNVWIKSPPVQPMTSIPQPWNAITIPFLPLDGVESLIGVPTIKIHRISDGAGLLSDEVSWGGPADPLTMTLVTITTPYYYAYEMNSAALDRTAGAQGYIAQINQGDNQLVAPLFIPTITPPWDRQLSEHTAAGSFGDAVTRVLGLKNHNTRWVPSAWDSANRPTAGVIHAYDSASNYDADSAPYSGDKRYAVSATYDGDGKLTLYGCRLEA